MDKNLKFSKDRSEIDELIENKFKNWDKNIQDLNITIDNNKKADSLFVEMINDSSNNLKNFQKIKIKYEEIKEHYLNYLSFGLENKIESYFLKSEKDTKTNINNKKLNPILLAKICFDHINGGRVGLVHGGCLYSALLLCINIFLDQDIKEDENISFQIVNINTTYKKKVPVDNIMIIKVEKIDKLENIEKANLSTDQEITAQMFDYFGSLCTKIYCKIKKFRKVPKF